MPASSSLEIHSEDEKRLEETMTAASPPFHPHSRCHPNKEKEMMKLRIVAPLVLAASAATIGLAPIAAADASVTQSPGNAQITATPGEASQEAAQNQQPFGGDEGALLYHHR
jgi:hypothetical protein